VGVQPNTEWLEGTGVPVDNGIVCDATCAVAGVEGVVAVGDVARWDHPTYGSIRIEHWTNAVEMADAAARTLLGRPEAFAPVPYFWSDQYEHKIQFVGRAAPTDSVEIAEGSIGARKFVALYRRGQEITAALGIGMPAKVMEWRRRLVDRG
ncbi:MAG: NAD(P)/FAD-dependent oxidoreductase, partial [Actinobacteria bacterium]|nr:NAD(P)/FAD-dependent oxidoreductase [Actinomycetota bacterium]